MHNLLGQFPVVAKCQTRFTSIERKVTNKNALASRTDCEWVRLGRATRGAKAKAKTGNLNLQEKCGKA